MSQRRVSDDHVQGEVDPTEFLRDLLRISPEDAAEVREDAAKAMEKKDDERLAEDH